MEEPYPQVHTVVCSGYTYELDKVVAIADEEANKWLRYETLKDEYRVKVKKVTPGQSIVALPSTQKDGRELSLFIYTLTIEYIEVYQG